MKIIQTNNSSKNDFFQINNFFERGGIGIFYTCEVFDVFELFEVGGGIKYV